MLILKNIDYHSLKLKNLMYISNMKALPIIMVSQTYARLVMFPVKTARLRDLLIASPVLERGWNRHVHLNPVLFSYHRCGLVDGELQFLH